jgi:hypothetical protein
MKLIRVPDDLVSKLLIASNRRGEPLIRYVTEILEKGVTADELDYSLKDIADSHEKEEAELVQESSIREVFERLLEKKLGPRIEEKTGLVSKERAMLERFLSQLSERSLREKPKEMVNEKEWQKRENGTPSSQPSNS